MTADDQVDGDVQRDQLDAADPFIELGYVPQLGDGVSEARVTGLLAVYDTRGLRYVEGATSRDALQLVDEYGATKSGRFQLRRV